MAIIHIGFDDIDSPFGGCTTDFVSKLVIEWCKRRYLEFIDYPNLIRLCPSVPWKTRGNGAVVIRLKVKDIDMGYKLFEEAVSNAYEYISYFRHPESSPAIALYIGEVSDELKWLGWKAVWDIIPLDLVQRIIDKLGDRVRIKHLGNMKRGVIGALASIGNTLSNTDYTYELIVYRKQEYWGSPRKIDHNSIKEMDHLTRGDTFLNYDYETDKALITPHGPDPVLLGIRGESPEILTEALNILRINEPIERWIIYRTNQGTDAHLRRITSLNEAYIYTGVIFQGRVSKPPKRIAGGHVIFSVSDGSREIDVAAYEPTGKFRDIVEKLWINDLVEVYGIVRPPSSKHGKTINLEKLRVIQVAPKIVYEAPKCPKCGKRMKSMGKGKGYKCPKCKYRDPFARKVPKEIPRELSIGWYQPPPRSFKHLMKPLERFGKEKKHPPKDLHTPWCYPC